MHKNKIVRKSSNFQVYNASAGSGKTFTLVKEYLKVVLASNDRYTFQKILAITFTNKAANEMKERVLSNLEDFSEGKENDLLQLLLSEMDIDKVMKYIAVGLTVWGVVNVLMKFMPEYATQLPLPI